MNPEMFHDFPSTQATILNQTNYFSCRVSVFFYEEDTLMKPA